MDYKVECEQDNDGWWFKVTHDGYQWTSIQIKDPGHEVPLMIEALRKVPIIKDGYCECGNALIDGLCYRIE